jgi:hypothetical protein
MLLKKPKGLSRHWRNVFGGANSLQEWPELRGVPPAEMAEEHDSIGLLGHRQPAWEDDTTNPQRTWMAPCSAVMMLLDHAMNALSEGRWNTVYRCELVSPSLLFPYNRH